MRLAMAQMRMAGTIQENMWQTISCMERAKKEGADLIFFPELQLSPFFPQYEKRDASAWLLEEDGPELTGIRRACGGLEMSVCLNVYLLQDGQRYDASIMIDGTGTVLGISKMVHITQAEHFYERDYYTPSDEGFRVYEMPFGKIGVVICFDRHIPGSIRSCARQGAEVVIIPTANLIDEPLELFEWEVRVQAFQNTVFTAMCNRVGQEGDVTFAGGSLAAAPDGSLLCRAGAEETLLTVDLPLESVARVRAGRPWLSFGPA